MRCIVFAASFFATASAGWLLSGCNAAGDCDRNPILGCGSWSVAPGSGGAGGGGGGTPEGCVPSETADPVGDECGVFVSSSLWDDSNGGTKEKPFKTLGAALAAASGRPVYACAEAFTEAVVVSAPVDLYGGLDCSNGWAYVGAATKTTLTALADAIPLVMQAGASGSRVEDFAVIAVDAVTPGGSSIAVIAQDGAEAELLRCELRAGAGAAGAAGTTPTEVGPNGEGQNGESGTVGTNSDPACTSIMAIVGGDGGLLTCDGIDVSGGPGGAGTKANAGGPGGPGQGQAGTPPLDGAGGKGQDAMACGQGNAGAEGNVGMAGPGAMGIGDINAAGYMAGTGSPGMSTGTPGQGGGGGGGAKTCDMMNMFAGPSGGGGGSGGCGGAPGMGGGAGGSSIGLLSHQAALTLTSVAIVTALGGAGGPGGNGQPGGGGGQPGAGGASNACTGGQGGSGGRGGSGGGGLGGHSIGIASKGTVPVQNDVTIVQGAHGPGGLGGDGDVTVQGADGQECKTLSFDEPGSCS